MVDILSNLTYPSSITQTARTTTVELKPSVQTSTTNTLCHDRDHTPTTTMNTTPKVRPPAVPIEPLNTEIAKLYTHIHPILVLSLYAFQFKAIVADPVPALTQTLVPLAVLQIVFVGLCLPPTGSSAVVVEKKKPGEKKKVPESQVGKTVIVRLALGWPFFLF